MDTNGYPVNVAITSLKSTADHSAFAGTVGRDVFHCQMPMVKKKQMKKTMNKCC